MPRELSGGEQARTAIARAIAHKPLILLADEPTQNLDPEQAKDVLQAFRDINTEGTTVIIATHDAALVDLLRTRVIQLEKGRIVRDSVGGYQRTPEDAETAQETANRGGFSIQPVRKVKITAIRSEG